MVYTLSKGAQAGWGIHLYCLGKPSSFIASSDTDSSPTECRTNYHNNYHVQDADWQSGSRLSTPMVWDTSVLLALLEDPEDRQTVLSVPHTGTQKDHFTAQLDTRNEHIILQGQPEIFHWCDKCM